MSRGQFSNLSDFSTMHAERRLSLVQVKGSFVLRRQDQAFDTYQRPAGCIPVPRRTPSRQDPPWHLFPCDFPRGRTQGKSLDKWQKSTYKLFKHKLFAPPIQNPRFRGPRKSLCASFSGKGLKKGPTSFFSRGFRGQKGPQTRHFGRQKV